MKIFVSYSRRDAGDFANQVDRHLSSFKYDIFTDVNDIRGGDVWSKTIEENISNCDIFVVIVTHGALQSPHVEKEVLQAQKDKKIIIPCFHRSVIDSDIKWGLDKIQGVEFTNEFQLARDLHSKVVHHNSRSKDISGIFGSTSKTVEETKTPPTTTLKSYTEGVHQKKDTVPPPSNISTGAIGGGGGGVPFPPPKYKAPEYDNNERIYGERDSSTKSQGINLKLIIIPIIAIAVIGVIVGVSYLNMAAPPATELVTPSPPPLEPEITSSDIADTAITPYNTTSPYNTTEVALFNKASNLYNQGKFQEAIAYYDKILEIDPDQLNALAGKGLMYETQGKYQEAIAYYDKVLEIDPDHVNALYGKGMIYNTQGKYQEAIAYYDKVLAIDPNYVEALHMKVYSLAKLDKNEEALPIIEGVIDSNPDNEYFLSTAAFIAHNLGKDDQAKNYFNKALDINPNLKNILSVELFDVFNSVMK